MQSAKIFFTILLVVHSWASTVRRDCERMHTFILYFLKNGIPPAICRRSARVYRVSVRLHSMHCPNIEWCYLADGQKTRERHWNMTFDLVALLPHQSDRRGRLRVCRVHTMNFPLPDQRDSVASFFGCFGWLLLRMAFGNSMRIVKL